MLFSIRIHKSCKYFVLLLQELLLTLKMMKAGATIHTIEIYKLLVPLKEPFVISLGAINEVQNIVVIIRTTDGCTGYGECSPYMTINGESMDTCFIVGQYFAKVLKGKNALDNKMSV